VDGSFVSTPHMLLIACECFPIVWILDTKREWLTPTFQELAFDLHMPPGMEFMAALPSLGAVSATCPLLRGRLAKLVVPPIGSPDRLDAGPLRDQRM